MQNVDAVLTQQLQRAGVEMLDRRDVDAASIVPRPGVRGGFPRRRTKASADGRFAKVTKARQDAGRTATMRSVAR
jgi:hypothetical protein